MKFTRSINAIVEDMITPANTAPSVVPIKNLPKYFRIDSNNVFSLKMFELIDFV